jgi:hypothetical protein
MSQAKSAAATGRNRFLGDVRSVVGRLREKLVQAVNRLLGPEATLFVAPRSTATDG